MGVDLPVNETAFLAPRWQGRRLARDCGCGAARVQSPTLTNLLWRLTMHNGGPLFVLAASNGSRKQSRWEPQANGSRKQSPRGVRSLDVAQGCVVDPDADSSGAWRVVCGT